MARLQKKKSISKKSTSGKKSISEKKSKDVDKNADLSVSSTKSSIAMKDKLAGTVKQKPAKKSLDIRTIEPNFFHKTIEFFKEVQVELKKVTWPTRKQTTGTTIVVIIFVFVVAAFLGLFDLGLSKLVQVVLT